MKKRNFLYNQPQAKDDVCFNGLQTGMWENISLDGFLEIIPTRQDVSELNYIKLQTLHE